MPILKHESDIYPDDLLVNPPQLDTEPRKWWCLYTLSRQEKELARALTRKQIPFYAPVIPKRYRSPNGRMRTSYVPLFGNYVFLFGNEAERGEAIGTSCVSRSQIVIQPEDFVRELQQIRALIVAQVPLTPEGRLEPGDRVRIRNGPFAGYEGSVIRRGGGTRFLLTLRFLEKGVSMEIDQGLLVPI